MSERIGRRKLLEISGLAALELLAGGCVRPRQESQPPVFGKQEDLDGIAGIPDVVDFEVVDTAEKKPGIFINKTGVAPHIIADPGGILVGVDFFAKENALKMFENSEGMIQLISPVTQAVADSESPFYRNLPEGGFCLATFGQGKIQIGEISINAGFYEKNTYMLIVRGVYPDGKQDSDRNRTIVFRDYTPGHLLVNTLLCGEKNNVGFWSEEQVMSMVATCHNAGTNWGAEGGSKVTMIALDVNTGAVEVWEHGQEGNLDRREARNHAMDRKSWQSLYSNIQR